MSRSITSADASGATFETVTSTGGFNAGDLVYYTPTGYNKVPTSAAPTSGMTATLSEPFPAYSRNGSGYFNNFPYPGLGFSTSVALLSSGNIVAVYGNPIDGYPYFVIIDPSTRALVAGPTVISTTFTSSGTNSFNGYNIGVAAFSGGNFVVYYANQAGGTAQRIMYAVYSNAGANVVAVTQDTGPGGINNPISGRMKGVTLANGGFVLAFGNSSNIYVRAYDGAGVAQFAWITVGGTYWNADSATQATWGLSARSDNTFMIAGVDNFQGAIRYAIYSYAGATVVSTTTFSLVYSPGINAYSADCCCLSDGTTFVIAYQTPTTASNNSGWAFRFLPTGNVLSSASFTAGNFYGSDGTAYGVNLRVWALSSGRFMITGLTNSSINCYAIFNSSGTPLLGTKGSTGNASVTRNFGGYTYSQAPVKGVIETGGNAEVYGGFGADVNTQFNGYVKVSLTDYNLVSSSTTTTSTAVSAANMSTGGYAPGGSTPSKAAFALNAGVYPYASPTGTPVVASGPYSTPVEFQQNVSWFDTCILSNGNLLVVVGDTSGNLTAYVRNPVTLANIISTNIGGITGNWVTGASVTAPGGKVCALDNGRFCIGVMNSSSNFRLCIFDSATLTQVGSSVNIGATMSWAVGSSSNNKDFDLCTINGDRIAVHYNYSNVQSNFAVYSNSLSVIQAPTNAMSHGGGVSNMGIAPNPMGFTVSVSNNGLGYMQAQSWYENTTNVFTSSTFNQAAYGGGTDAAWNRPVTVGNGVIYLHNTFSNSRNIYRYWGGSSTNNFTGLSLSGISTAKSATGITASGNIVNAGALSSSNININTPESSGQVDMGSAWVITSRDTCSKLQALYGNVMLYGYLVSTNNALKFGTFTVNISPDSIAVASTDTTTGVPLYPQATTATSLAIAGYTFAGVAVTDCTPGGTGVIQSTGTTNLNSNYPSTTAQTFDYTGYAAPGVKGTISGRSVSMRKS